MTEDTSADFSLADLADLDVSAVAEMRYESLPAGVYEFKVVAAEMTEGANRQTNAKQFMVEFKFEVVECKASIERGVDKESLVGKPHTEKRYITPDKAQEGIGYLRAFISDIGGNSAGRLGGIAGGEPGIIDETVGLVFTGKITKKKDKDDPSVSYARLKVEPAKK